MRSLKAAHPKFAEGVPRRAPDRFPGAEVVVPGSVEDVAEILRWASEQGAMVVPWGGGTQQGLGFLPDPDVVLDMSGLADVVAWEPDDLTVVVGAGARIADLEGMLNDRGQTALLSEQPGTGTVGGAVATGVSGYRRGRYGPTRDRLLEVTLVTGDGRLVRGGGRVVKNVTGYDLPRLATGSMGALGVITSVCLKLWPLPVATATVAVEDAETARLRTWRPLAALSSRTASWLYLGGTPDEISGQVSQLGGSTAVEGLHWPAPPQGETTWSLRVPADLLPAAIAQIPSEWDYVAQHGVGVAMVSDPGGDVGSARRLRTWAEGVGGSLVLVDGSGTVRSEIDPWGSPPPAVDIQRRLVARFDPDRVVNRGRLPGGL